MANRRQPLRRSRAIRAPRASAGDPALPAVRRRRATRTRTRRIRPLSGAKPLPPSRLHPGPVAKRNHDPRPRPERPAPRRSGTPGTPAPDVDAGCAPRFFRDRFPARRASRHLDLGLRRLRLPALPRRHGASSDEYAHALERLRSTECARRDRARALSRHPPPLRISLGMGDRPRPVPRRASTPDQRGGSPDVSNSIPPSRSRRHLFSNVDRASHDRDRRPVHGGMGLRARQRHRGGRPRGKTRSSHRVRIARDVDPRSIRRSSIARPSRDDRVGRRRRHSLFLQSGHRLRRRRIRQASRPRIARGHPRLLQEHRRAAAGIRARAQRLDHASMGGGIRASRAVCPRRTRSRMDPTAPRGPPAALGLRQRPVAQELPARGALLPGLCRPQAFRLGTDRRRNAGRADSAERRAFCRNAVESRSPPEDILHASHFRATP